MTRNQKLIYLAGLIDGDGCFNVTRVRASFVPRILIVNTDKNVMEWLVENFGGDCTKTSVKNKINWKPRYTWRLSHKKALDLATELEPYLIIKQKAAEIFVLWSVIQEEFKPLDRKSFYEILKERMAILNLKGI